MSIPLPNQIKVAPRTPTPEPEASSEPSPSGAPGKPSRPKSREIRPMTNRLGRMPEFRAIFEKMGEQAAEAARNIEEHNRQRRAAQPKNVAAQQDPVRNKRRTGRRAQRP